MFIQGGTFIPDSRVRWRRTLSSFRTPYPDLEHLSGLRTPYTDLEAPYPDQKDPIIA